MRRDNELYSVHPVDSDLLEALIFPSQVGLDEVSFGRGRPIEFSEATRLVCKLLESRIVAHERMINGTHKT